mgnify:CR=1 FL=1
MGRMMEVRKVVKAVKEGKEERMVIRKLVIRIRLTLNHRLPPLLVIKIYQTNPNPPNTYFLPVSPSF